MNLKELRENKNITQKDLATSIGVSESYYSLIENGIRTPKPPLIMKIAKILNFDWKDFYETDTQ